MVEREGIEPHSRRHRVYSAGMVPAIYSHSVFSETRKGHLVSLAAFKLLGPTAALQSSLLQILALGIEG